MSTSQVEDFCSACLNNDVLRNIYVKYIEKLNAENLEKMTETISGDLAGIVASTTTDSENYRGFVYNKKKIFIIGVVRTYGSGRICILNFNNHSIIFRIKIVEEAYVITDYEYEGNLQIVVKTICKFVDKFNALCVITNNRKPKKRKNWIRFDTRLKFIEDLAICTNFPEKRIEELIDG